MSVTSLSSLFSCFYADSSSNETDFAKAYGKDSFNRTGMNKENNAWTHMGDETEEW